MGKVTESIYSSATVVIPMADVIYVIHLSSGIQIILKHTTYNFEADEFNNSAFIPMKEKDEFLSAWCMYRSEIESDTLMDCSKEA